MNNNIKVNYPNRFFSFENGKGISDDEVNEWIQICIDELEKNKNEDYHYRSSGNTQVIVWRIKVSDREYYYEVEVNKGREFFETEKYTY